MLLKKKNISFDKTILGVLLNTVFFKNIAKNVQKPLKSSFPVFFLLILNFFLKSKSFSSQHLSPGLFLSQILILI